MESFMLSYKEYKFLNNLEIKAESKKDEGKDEDKEKSSKGLTAAQKKLPKALQDAILAKQGKSVSKGKDEDDEKDDEKDEEKDEEKEKSSKGLTAAQKKLPKALQDAILAKQGKGGSEGKKEESSWWKSVSSMFDTDSDHKNWDGGWGEIVEARHF